MAKLTGTTVVRHPESGEVVALHAGGDLPDWAADLVGAHLVAHDEDTQGQAGEGKSPYAEFKKADLLAEIDRRNSDRADDAKLTPASDKNADLIAALEADDQPE